MVEARGHAKAVQFYFMQPLRPRRRLLDRLAKLRRNETGKRRRALALASPPVVGLDGLRGRTLGDTRHLQPKLEGEISPLNASMAQVGLARSQSHYASLHRRAEGRRALGAWVPRLEVRPESTLTARSRRSGNGRNAPESGRRRYGEYAPSADIRCNARPCFNEGKRWASAKPFWPPGGYGPPRAFGGIPIAQIHATSALWSSSAITPIDCRVRRDTVRAWAAVDLQSRLRTARLHRSPDSSPPATGRPRQRLARCRQKSATTTRPRPTKPCYTPCASSSPSASAQVAITQQLSLIRTPLHSLQ